MERPRKASKKIAQSSQPAVDSLAGQVDAIKVKSEPVEEAMETASTTGKGPTILAAETFTHGGVRKAKFEPKIPARRQKKQVVKSEPGEGGEAELPNEIMKLVKQSQEDASTRNARRTDVRAPVRVAFGFGSAVGGRAAAGFHKGGGSGTRVDKKSSIKSFQSQADDDMGMDEKNETCKKDLGETWDLFKYYPITLPLQRPGTVEEDFREANAQELDENAISAADELELTTESDEDRLLFFQLPSFLPLSKEALEGLGCGSGASSSNRTDSSGASTSLDKLPAGHMGKLRIYSSGAVKLQLGDTVLEAVGGSQCVFAQELTAINPVSKECCFLGDVRQRVILIPSMDDVLKDNSSAFG